MGDVTTAAAPTLEAPPPAGTCEICAAPSWATDFAGNPLHPCCVVTVWTWGEYRCTSCSVSRDARRRRGDDTTRNAA